MPHQQMKNQMNFERLRLCNLKATVTGKIKFSYFFSFDEMVALFNRSDGKIKVF